MMRKYLQVRFGRRRSVEAEL